MTLNRLLINTSKIQQQLPGPSNITYGDLNAGYYGVVDGSDFITGDDLAASIGLTSGTSQYSDAGWLKFSSDGHVIYIAKKPFRYGLSWEDIYKCGAVHGDDSYGQIHASPNRLQNARIVFNDMTYRVRLMRGYQSETPTGNPINLSRDVELLARTLRDNEKWKGNTWENFTIQDIGQEESWISNSGYTWIRETYWKEYNRNRLMTARHNLYKLTPSQKNSTDSDYWVGWRPVLELIQ